MSLRAFHLFFISLSAVMAAFCSAWAFSQFRADHELIYGAGSVLSALLSVQPFPAAAQASGLRRWALS